jgi:PGF-CTERM protein
MTRTKITNGLLVVGVALAMCTVFLPSVAANGHGGLGTFVEQGDQDFTPTLTTASEWPADVEICRLDFGNSGDISDDAFYLNLNDDSTVSTHDIRLTEGQGNAAGTVVQDGDNVEQNTDTVDNCNNDAEINYVDTDNNGDLTDEDYAYIGVDDTATGLDAPSDGTPGTFHIRLVDTANNDAGTLVRSGHDDLVSYGSQSFLTVPGTPGIYMFETQPEENGDATFEDEDWLYVSPEDNSDTTPYIYSTRLKHPGFDHGTWVTEDDSDHVPKVNANEGENSATAEPEICRFDQGTADRITDDVFTLDMDDSDDATNDDVFLTGWRDNAPGDLVDDGDVTMKDTSPVNCEPTDWAWTDTDNDGTITDEDYVYVGHDDSTGDRVEASEDDGDWWIRLTPTDDRDAGSIVLNGAPDVTQWGDGQPFAPANNGNLDAEPEVHLFDLDNSGGTTGPDFVYVTSGVDLDAGDLLPQFSLRLHHADEAFGSHVTLGDTDFVPRVNSLTLDGNGEVNLCRINFGNSGSFTDDGFYLDMDANGVDNHDVRLVDVQGNEAGTVVTQGDETEATSSTDTAADCSDPEIVAVDQNEDGDLTSADWYFLSNEAANDDGPNPTDIQSDGLNDGDAATDPDTLTIRLSSTPDGEPGTLLRTGDTAAVAWTGTASECVDEADTKEDCPSDIAFFDADNSAAGTSAGGEDFTPGDVLYGPARGSTPDGDPPRLFSLRIHGQFEEPEPPEGPSVSVSSPTADGDYMEGDTVDIEGSASPGDNSLDTVEATLNGDDQDLDVADDFNFTGAIEDAPAGEHTLTVTATDTADMTGTASVTFTVEEETPEPPTVSINQPDDGSTVAPGDSLDVRGSATGDGITVTATANGQSVQVSGTQSWQGTVTAPADPGSYTIEATVTDSAGQTASDSVTFTVEEESTDDGTMDDGATDDSSADDSTADDSTADDSGTDDSGPETPGFTAVAALAALVGLAALARRD